MGTPAQVPPTVCVQFSAEINPKTAETLLRTVGDLCTKGVKTVQLHFTTMGGEVSQGIHVYNCLRALPCKIVMHNTGAVNSIGNVIFLAGDERYASPGTTFMFHGVGFNSPPGVRLEEKLLTERLEGIQADHKKIARVFEDRARFPDGEIEQLFLQAATKDADFAKERGIIHDIREAQVGKGVPVLTPIFQR